MSFNIFPLGYYLSFKVFEFDLLFRYLLKTHGWQYRAYLTIKRTHEGQDAPPQDTQQLALQWAQDLAYQGRNIALRLQ